MAASNLWYIVKILYQAYKIISFFDKMLFTPTDYNGTKCYYFVMVKFIQTQFVRHCRPINHFFNLTWLQISLQTYQPKKERI